MSGGENRPDWDDDRTIADMSQVDRPNLLWPRLRTDNRFQTRSGEQERPYTPQERRWAVLGAMRAGLMIAGVFIAGLGLVIAGLLLLWK